MRGWVTLTEMIVEFGRSRLAELCKNPDEVLFVAVSTGAATYDLPLYRARHADFYVDDVLVSGAILKMRGATDQECDAVLFEVPPATGKLIGVMSSDAVYVTDVETQLAEAQAKIRSRLLAHDCDVPADDADPATVPVLLKKHAMAITAYLLMTSPKRTLNLPNIERRYEDLMGSNTRGREMPGEYDRIGKGSELDWLLPKATIARPLEEGVSWGSDPPVYDSPNSEETVTPLPWDYT